MVLLNLIPDHNELSKKWGVYIEDAEGNRVLETRRFHRYDDSANATLTIPHKFGGWAVLVIRRGHEWYYDLKQVKTYSGPIYNR